MKLHWPRALNSKNLLTVGARKTSTISARYMALKPTPSAGSLQLRALWIDSINLSAMTRGSVDSVTELRMRFLERP